MSAVNLNHQISRGSEQMIKGLHDFIKDTYDHSTDLSQIESTYQNWQIQHATNSGVSDYQLGYNQALRDLANNRKILLHSQELINFANLISITKARQINEFIKGYHDGKFQIKKHHRSDVYQTNSPTNAADNNETRIPDNNI